MRSRRHLKDSLTTGARQRTKSRLAHGLAQHQLSILSISPVAPE